VSCAIVIPLVDFRSILKKEKTMCIEWCSGQGYVPFIKTNNSKMDQKALDQDMTKHHTKQVAD
jgi:hypothetical protein